MPHEDNRLRELYQELRAGTRASDRTPDFSEMIERARSDSIRPSFQVVGGARPERSRGRRQAHRFAWAGGWASIALAAALAGILLVRDGGNQDQEFESLVVGFAMDVSGGAWRSPTAGLLEVPGLELIRGVPSVGSSVRTDGLDNGPEATAPDQGEERP